MRMRKLDILRGRPLDMMREEEARHDAREGEQAGTWEGAYQKGAAAYNEARQAKWAVPP